MKLLRSILGALALVALAARALAADPDYAAPGPFAAHTVDETWTDAARQRGVPVRVRLPETSERVPVILFSHGLGGSIAGGAEWGEQWASHGLAVVHVQHPGSDESLWKGKPAGERWAGLRSGADLTQFLARIADIRFVVDELARRPIAPRLRLDRLGMSGHSFGAITTLYLGGQKPAVPTSVELVEPRFAAFLAFSPQAAGADPIDGFTGFTRPALLVTGTLDGRPYPGYGATPAQRLIPFESMPGSGNKFLLVVDQADHLFFNGTRGLRDFLAIGREGIDFGAIEARGYALVKAVSTAYWRAYLRNDEVAGRWLKEGGAADLAATGGYLKAK
jgi:dienelactone hydrolase